MVGLREKLGELQRALRGAQQEKAEATTAREVMREEAEGAKAKFAAAQSNLAAARLELDAMRAQLAAVEQQGASAAPSPRSTTAARPRINVSQLSEIRTEREKLNRALSSLQSSVQSTVLAVESPRGGAAPPMAMATVSGSVESAPSVSAYALPLMQVWAGRARDILSPAACSRCVCAAYHVSTRAALFAASRSPRAPALRTPHRTGPIAASGPGAGHARGVYEFDACRLNPL